MVSDKETVPFVGGATPREVTIDIAINLCRLFDYIDVSGKCFRKHRHGGLARPKWWLAGGKMSRVV